MAAVKGSFAKNIADHFQASLTYAEEVDNKVTGRADIRSDAIRAQGLDHRTTSYSIEFKDGKIVRWSSPLPGTQAVVVPGQ